MKKSILYKVVLSYLMIFVGSVQVNASEVSLFVNGDINPAYMGKAAILIAEVIEIREGPGQKDYFKLDVHRKGVKPIWTSTFAPVIKGEIKVGDKLKFIGHVRKADSLDSSGKLQAFIQSPAFFISRSIQKLK